MTLSSISRLRFRWSIGYTLALAITLLVAILMAVTTLIDVRRENGRYRDELQDRGLLMASTLSDVMADSLYFTDIDHLTDIGNVVSGEQDILFVRVYSSEGILLGDSGNESRYPVGQLTPESVSNPLLPGQVTFEQDDYILEVTGPIHVGEEFLGWVRFGYDVSPLRAKVRALTIQRVWLSSGIVGASTILAFLFAQYFVRPIKRLVRETSKIASGEAVSPAENPRRDELGDLALSFSHMSRSLRERTDESNAANQALRRLNNELEIRVEERTADLRNANQNLWSEIRERERTEHALRQSSRLAAIGQLAAGVAHEVNNPLNGAMGLTELLMMEDLPEHVQDDLRKICADTERAAKITQSLLAFARKREPNLGVVDLSATVDRALELKQNDFKIYNIDVTVQLTFGSAEVSGDEHQLVEALLNILNNAQQAVSDAPGNRSIRIIGTTSHGTVSITIRDDGPGISPEDIDKVFDPFFTTRGADGGTGLGLSVCQGIIERHGGKLWVESELGRGASFQIELPAIQQETATDAPRHSAEKPAVTAKQILVVDDERDVRDFAARVLSLDGHVVDHVAGGQEAWIKLQQKTYDCIFMDLRMPHMDGRDLYSLIEAQDKEQASKIVFITGDTISRETREFVSTKRNPLLEKPFTAEQLRRMLWSLQGDGDAGRV